jgi:uncharacterized protein
VKYVLWALLLYLGWRWYLSKKSPPSSPQQEASAATEEAPEAGASTEKMVSCAHCGIHLPISESVQGTGALHFCSDEHRLRHSGH